MSSREGNHGGGGQGVLDDDGGDEDDATSSSSSPQELSSLSKQLSRELSVYSVDNSHFGSPSDALDDEEDQDLGQGAVSKAPKAAKSSDPETEEKARELFLQGVELEQDGKMFDAILKYKKAVQLVPDIEQRTFNFTKGSSSNKTTNSNLNKMEEKTKESSSVEKPGEMEPEDPEVDMDIDTASDLVTKFVKIRNMHGLICQPAVSSKGKTHISCLPFEVLINILKWVVSHELDLRSLERVSEVCRLFYLAARSNDLWKPICLRTWAIPEVPRDVQLLRKGGNGNPPMTWRQIYFSMPRVQLNGCYIARMSYIRPGERGFQDNEFYRSWHVVQYYRLIRFFPGGRMAMVTTAEEPANAVKGLNNRFSSSIQGVMFGTYTTQDSRVLCQVHKLSSYHNNIARLRRRRGGGPVSNYVFEVPEQDFLFELELVGRRFQRLQWKSYSVISRYTSGASPDSRSEFDVTNSSTFPSLHYSPVKSYTSDVTYLSLD